jgi:ribosomal protein S18 acetylase RimI-like enzyme
MATYRRLIAQRTVGDQDQTGGMVMIRRARPYDAAALAGLARSAYAHYVDRIGSEPAPMNADYMSLIDAGQIWVAEQDAALVGLLVLKRAADHMLLDNVAVSPESQGHGVGARLLEFTDEHARAQGLAEVRLYTNEAMTENIGFYTRHGYRETHRGTDQGYRRVFFTKHL